MAKWTGLLVVAQILYKVSCLYIHKDVAIVMHLILMMMCTCGKSLLVVCMSMRRTCAFHGKAVFNESSYSGMYITREFTLPVCD